MTNFHRYFLVVGVPLVIPLQSFGAENFSEIVLLSFSQEKSFQGDNESLSKKKKRNTDTDREKTQVDSCSNQTFSELFWEVLAGYCHCLWISSLKKWKTWNILMTHDDL